MSSTAICLFDDCKDTSKCICSCSSSDVIIKKIIDYDKEEIAHEIKKDQQNLYGKTSSLFFQLLHKFSRYLFSK
jgi:hypothetical protein